LKYTNIHLSPPLSEGSARTSRQQSSAFHESDPTVPDGAFQNRFFDPEAVGLTTGNAVNGIDIVEAGFRWKIEKRAAKRD
jgi:hypothetical protein